MRTAPLTRALAFLAAPLLAACITEARDGLTCETDDHCVANGYLCEDGRCSTGAHQPPAALRVTFDTAAGKANTVLQATVTALDKRQPPLQKKSLPDAAVTITCSPGAVCPKSATLQQGVATFEVTFNALGSGTVTASLPGSGSVPVVGTASLDIAEPACASGTHWCGTLPCAAGPSAQSCGNGGACVSCPAPPPNSTPATCTAGACDFACLQGYNKCGAPGQQLCTSDTNVASCGVGCKVCAPGAICYAPAGAATACCTPDCAGKNEGDPAGCGKTCPLTPCLYGQRFVAGACACDTTRCTTGCCSGKDCVTTLTDSSCGAGAACAACTLPAICGGAGTPGVCGAPPAVNWWGTSADGAALIVADTQVPATQDGDVVVLNYQSLTIQQGKTLTTSVRSKGLIIYVHGDAKIDGTLTMTGRGAAVDPAVAGVPTTGLRLVRKRQSGTDTLAGSDLAGCGSAAIAAEGNQAGISGNGTIYSILREGAAGGVAALATKVGGSGARQSGGGGSGGAWASGNLGGAGGAGTCFSGGTGGGGAGMVCDPTTCGNGYHPGSAGKANGGAGGAGGTPVDGSHPSGGGAGNPGGSSDPGGGEGGAGTGGLLVLLVGGNLTVGASGIISADGVHGGTGSGGTSGGGSGGGNVLILYGGKLVSNGAIQAVGGILGSSPGGAASGGNGSVQVANVTF